MEGIVTFQEVKDIFKYANIGVDQYEQFWYKHAWNILENQGATKYNSDVEHCTIYIYAVVLCKTYYEFCEIVFGDSCYDEFVEILNDYLNDIQIGQLVRPYIINDEFYDNPEDALHILFDSLKYKVFDILKEEMDPCEVFAWMYCAGDPPKENDFDDEDHAYEFVYFQLRIPLCHDEFAKMVDSHLDEIVNDLDGYGSKVDGYDYICSLM